MQLATQRHQRWSSRQIGGGCGDSGSREPKTARSAEGSRGNRGKEPVSRRSTASVGDTARNSTLDEFRRPYFNGQLSHNRLVRQFHPDRKNTRPDRKNTRPIDSENIVSSKSI